MPALRQARVSELDNMLAAWQEETYDSQMTTASLSGDDSEDEAEEALYRESDRRAGCGAANKERSRRGRG